LILFFAGLLIGSLPAYDYFADPKHTIHHVPSTVLAASLVLLAFFSLGLGLILNSINLRLLEVEKMISKGGK
jgi:hypothetical protein